MDKEKSPLELKTGKEIYEYLKGKSKQETDAFWISRGAKEIKGQIYCFNESGILEIRYELEKERRENSINKECRDDTNKKLNNKPDGLEK